VMHIAAPGNDSGQHEDPGLHGQVRSQATTKNRQRLERAERQSPGQGEQA
jgi:hypothetical protein